MSIRIGRDEAEQRFSELLSQVSKGEEIEIVSDGKEIVRLVPPLSSQGIRLYIPLTKRHKEFSPSLTAYTEPGEFAEAIIYTSSTKPKFSPSVTLPIDNKLLSSDENFEPLENQNELDEIMEDISLIQSRMEEDRLEIDTSIRNIDSMLTSIED